MDRIVKVYLTTTKNGVKTQVTPALISLSPGRRPQISLQSPLQQMDSHCSCQTGTKSPSLHQRNPRQRHCYQRFLSRQQQSPIHRQPS